jgi:hypothetical protein
MLNYNRIRRQARRDLRAFTAFGLARFTRLFTDIIASDYLVNEMQVRQAYIEFYQYAGVQAAVREYEAIREREPTKAKPPDFFINTWRSYFENYVKGELASRVTAVTENTRAIIQDALVRGQNAGLLSQDLAKLVNEAVNNRARALAIARTEATWANSLGKELSANQWGSETGQDLFKVWVHSGSPNERPEHVAVQGNPIPQGQSFTVGGDSLRFPGDPDAPAAQVVNCGCTTVFMSRAFASRTFTP